MAGRQQPAAVVNAGRTLRGIEHLYATSVPNTSDLFSAEGYRDDPDSGNLRAVYVDMRSSLGRHRRLLRVSESLCDLRGDGFNHNSSDDLGKVHNPKLHVS